MAHNTIIIDVLAPNSTGVRFLPDASLTDVGSGHFSVIGPLAAGAPLGTVNVQPSGWTGSLTATVTPAESVTVMPSATTPGSYAVTVGTTGWPVADGYTLVLAATP